MEEVHGGKRGKKRVSETRLVSTDFPWHQLPVLGENNVVFLWVEGEIFHGGGGLSPVFKKEMEVRAHFSHLLFFKYFWLKIILMPKRHNLGAAYSVTDGVWDMLPQNMAR